MKNIKVELSSVGKGQADLVKELRSYGIHIYPSQLSVFINGVDIGKKATEVLECCEKIIDKWKKDKQRKEE